ncbi:MAG: hypothetical protein OEW12_00100 [Deltaproteobacteria bacterium]|nr:hypothetical protein [Deltaproteobacteria bacterium]
MAANHLPVRGGGHGGWRILAGVLLWGVFLAGMGRSTLAVELCSDEANLLMKQAGIEEGKIKKLCRMTAVSRHLLSITLQRTENELGYCRVTLAMKNNTLSYLNQLTLTVEGGGFEIIKFNNILPGDTGYASTLSRTLMDCAEAKKTGLRFPWPASLRMDDHTASGRWLDQHKPALLDPHLSWSR